MTIVATEDSRNVSWAGDKTAFGHRMLSKMGWTKGQGLGKNLQGSTTNLRGVRRSDENLGIGAMTDSNGFDGWEKTRGGFQNVLEVLQKEHGSMNDKTKKKKKKEKKMKNNLTLAQNKVTAGHAKKMRDAKDLSSKSRKDMAAIFGMKVEDYDSRQSQETHFVSDASDDAEVVSSKNKKPKKKEKKRKREEISVFCRENAKRDDDSSARDKSKKEKTRKHNEDNSSKVSSDSSSEIDDMPKREKKKRKKSKKKKK